MNILGVIRKQNLAIKNNKALYDNDLSVRDEDLRLMLVRNN